MASDDWESVWQDALKQYKKETGSDPPQDYVVAGTFTVDKILDATKQKKDSFDTLRANGKSIRAALVPISRIIQSAAETTGHIAKRFFPPAEAICSGVVVLLKVAEGVSEKYDRICEMLDDLEYFLNRAKLYSEGGLSDQMRKLLVTYLSQILVILGLATKAIRKGRGREYFKTLLCKDTKVKDAFEKLDRLSTLEGHVVATANLSATNKVLASVAEGMQARKQDSILLREIVLSIAQEAANTSQNTQEHRALLEEIRSLIPSQLQEYIETQLRSDIHIWLGAPNSGENQFAASKRRTPGTGNWFMKDERYLRWKTQEDVRPLWLYGKPGAGKSILVSTIVTDIEFEQRARAFVFYAYFYFDFRDGMKQNRRELVASLIEQLAFSHPEGVAKLEHLYKLYQSCGRSHPTLDDLTRLLRDVLQIFAGGTTYIIIDALDECIERDGLLDIIQDVQQWNFPNVCLLLASRKEQEFSEVLSSLSVAVDLETSVVNPDISCFVETALRNHPKLQKWRNHPTVPGKIKERLSQADGMFRWAFCQLDSLSRCINAAAVSKILKSLPASLGETYERILLGIGDDQFEQVFAVLQWLAFSEEPMTLAQITEVLAIDFEADPPTFSEENRPPDSNDILSICASLVNVNPNDCLELAHFSVKEYLMSSSSRRPRAARYHVDPLNSHTFIARCSLAYLFYFSEPLEVYVPGSYFKVEENPVNIFGGGELPYYGLALYAAKNWRIHSNKGNFDLLSGPILSLFRSRGNQFQNSIRIYDIDQGNSNFKRRDGDIASPIYYAALLRNPMIIASLMETYDINVFQKGSMLGFPLQIASFMGHEEIVKYLLEKGANVDVQGGKFGCALQAASAMGHKTVVEILLERGADVNACGGHFGVALQAASSIGCKLIVKMLLERERMSTLKVDILVMHCKWRHLEEMGQLLRYC